MPKRIDASKQSNRRNRLKLRVARGAEGAPLLADRAAFLSQRLWSELIAPALLPGDENVSGGAAYQATSKESKALRCFYNHAVAGDVAKEHITPEAARAYLVDKWAGHACTESHGE